MAKNEEKPCPEIYGSVSERQVNSRLNLIYSIILPYKVRKMILKTILALMLSYSTDFFSLKVGNIFGPMSHKEMEERIPK